jgi:5-methylcytosine-specific restriction endonuclease McrA
MRRVTRISTYHWYLRSPYWKVRQRHTLKRDNYRCRKCRLRADHVHHVSYVNVFNEPPSDLASLCARCHADLHHKTPANDNQLTLFPLLARDRPSR